MPNLSPMNLMAAGKELMVRARHVFEERVEVVRWGLCAVAQFVSHGQMAAG